MKFANIAALPTVGTSLPSRECGLKSGKYLISQPPVPVTPLAGVWIEIADHSGNLRYHIVTPLAGVWIEILFRSGNQRIIHVTPLAGVWIEITSFDSPLRISSVTPLAGVWIEITYIILHCTYRIVTPLAGVWVPYHSKDLKKGLEQAILKQAGLK